MNLTSLLLILTFAFSSTVLAGFMPVANVTKIQGTILYNNEKMKVGEEVAEGMELSLSKGQAEIKFQNGHVLRLAGAKIKVETLNPKNTNIRLLKGQVYAKVLPMTTDETFVLSSDRAAFTMNETNALLEERKKNTSLLVLNGSVQIKNAKGSETVVNGGEILTIVKKDQDLKPIAALKKRLDKEGPIFLQMR